MMIQLNPPIPLNTPKGKGLAHILIDYGPELHLHWTVVIEETGELWTFSNADVRALANSAVGRESPRRPWQPPAPTPAPSKLNGAGAR
jgi:hypothetical protein